MSDILEDFSAPVLVEAIKANLFEWLEYLGRSPKAELYDGPNMTWVITGIPHYYWNCVLRAQFAPDDVDAKIDETVTHFKSRNVARFTWWTEPATQPTDLGKHLEAHGFTYTEGSTGMAVDLLALNEDVTAPSALRIERVRDTGTLKKWVQASIIANDQPDTSENTWFDLFSGLGFDLPLHNYVGFLKGEPVAVSELFLAAGVAGIYVVGTIPEARRQGIGSTLTLVPLREARDMGYRIGVLGATPMGLGVYRRLGFQEYCKLDFYLWAGETSQ